MNPEQYEFLKSVAGALGSVVEGMTSLPTGTYLPDAALERFDAAMEVLKTAHQTLKWFNYDYYMPSAVERMTECINESRKEGLTGR